MVGVLELFKQQMEKSREPAEDNKPGIWKNYKIRVWLDKGSVIEVPVEPGSIDRC